MSAIDPMPVPAAQPQPLVHIGQAYATDEWMVTPTGTWRVKDTNVNALDQTTVTTHTPAWAVILVIVFIWFFLLSLLFLLARKRRVSGYVVITLVAADGRSYNEHIPVATEMQRADLFSRVNYLQQLIGYRRQQQSS